METILKNPVTLQRVSDALVSAMDKEGLSGRDVANILDIPAMYVSIIRTTHNNHLITEKVWQKVKAWVDSGQQLSGYKLISDDVPDDQEEQPMSEEEKYRNEVRAKLTKIETGKKTNVIRVDVENLQVRSRQAPESGSKILSHADIAGRVLSAIDKNGLSFSRASKFLRIHAVYFTYLKSRGKYVRIPKETWVKLRQLVENGSLDELLTQQIEGEEFKPTVVEFEPTSETANETITQAEEVIPEVGSNNEQSPDPLLPGEEELRAKLIPQNEIKTMARALVESISLELELEISVNTTIKSIKQIIK